MLIAKLLIGYLIFFIFHLFLFIYKKDQQILFQFYLQTKSENLIIAI